MLHAAVQHPTRRREGSPRRRTFASARSGASDAAGGWLASPGDHGLPAGVEQAEPPADLRQFLKLSLTAGHEHVRAPAALPGVECDPHRLDAIERCVICDSGIPLIAVVEQLMLVDPE